MSYRVKVINQGSVDIHERFKGAEIKIPAGGSVEMDRDEAVEFASQYRPIITDGEKNPLPSGFKKLAFEPGLYGHQNQAASDLMCHATGKTAMNKAELQQMIKANAHLLADDAAKDALREEMKADLEDFKAELLAEVGKGRSGKGPKNGQKEGANPQG